MISFYIWLRNDEHFIFNIFVKWASNKLSFNLEISCWAEGIGLWVFWFAKKLVPVVPTLQNLKNSTFLGSYKCVYKMLKKVGLVQVAYLCTSSSSV